MDHGTELLVPDRTVSLVESTSHPYVNEGAKIQTPKRQFLDIRTEQYFPSRG